MTISSREKKAIEQAAGGDAPNEVLNSPHGSTSNQTDDDERQQWFVLRATYRRELKAQQLLEARGIATFIPMRYVMKQTRARKMRLLVPAVNNLVFAHATKSQLQEFKTGVPFVQYYTSPRDGRNLPVTVSDGDMEQFRRVAATYDDELQYLRPDEVDLARGTRVRIHGGVFDGMIGTFVKVAGKRNRRVVIAIQHVIAVALAYVDPDYIEIL